MSDGPRTTMVPCAGCDGEGAIEHFWSYDPRDGSPVGSVEVCRYCDGTGGEEIEMQPITLDDLDELRGPP